MCLLSCEKAKVANHVPGKPMEIKQFVRKAVSYVSNLDMGTYAFQVVTMQSQSR